MAREPPTKLTVSSRPVFGGREKLEERWRWRPFALLSLPSINLYFLPSSQHFWLLISSRPNAYTHSSLFIATRRGWVLLRTRTIWFIGGQEVEVHEIRVGGWISSRDFQSSPWKFRGWSLAVLTSCPPRTLILGASTRGFCLLLNSPRRHPLNFWSYHVFLETVTCWNSREKSSCCYYDSWTCIVQDI